MLLIEHVYKRVVTSEEMGDNPYILALQTPEYHYIFFFISTGGGGGYTVLPLSVCPRYFSSHFSQQLLMAEI